MSTFVIVLLAMSYVVGWVVVAAMNGPKFAGATSTKGMNSDDWVLAAMGAAAWPAYVALAILMMPFVVVAMCARWLSK